jgi:NitT/TauT family transport system substrate-binding protein
MRARHAEGWTRRRFLGGLTLAGTAELLGLHPRSVAAEPPPETTRLRLAQFVPCTAPQYAAEDLLKAEGFTEVSYLPTHPATRTYSGLARGEFDLGMHVPGLLATWLDAGYPIVVLAGVHTRCYELFGTGSVRAIRDLKGKTVSVPVQGGGHQLFLSSMVAYIGLHPGTDLHWVTHPSSEAMQLLAEGKIDAYLGFPPEPQELRAKQIGRVIVNTTLDRPWSDYFCCMAAGNREFVRQYPVATKRALRAILKATDLCAAEPERVARSLVDRGFTPRYDYALQVLKDVRYDKWREYDPADTLRFHALRLQEVGLITNSPQKLIAQGTDWRFLNELKQELKG